MISTLCDWCGKSYSTYSAWLKYKNKFCSRVCKNNWNKTQSGYWKGKKIPFYSRPNTNVSGSHNPHWKGGKVLDKNGYFLILNPNHPFSDCHGYVREHRLIMENKIGRYLNQREVVHHVNHNKQDNAIENLRLFSSGGEHQRAHYYTGDTKKLKNSPGWKRAQTS